MYNAVLSQLKQNAVIWQPVPAMVNTIDDFESLLAEIDTYRQITQGSKKGITLQKATQQALVISHTYELLSVLYAMANATNNPVLLSKVNFTESDLLKTRDAQLVSICLRTAEIATEYLADLLAYGVTQSELNLLKEEIGLFADNLPTLRVSVSERKAANEKLKDLFLQVDALLKNQLDRLMVRYRKSQPDFYSLYHNLRRIVNYGTRHVKAKEPENTAQGLNI